MLHSSNDHPVLAAVGVLDYIDNFQVDMNTAKLIQ